MSKCTRTGKIRYRSEDEANVVVNNVKRNNHKREKVPVRSYYCDKCGGYHLTSKSMVRTSHPVVLKLAKSFQKFIQK